ncbi:MAG: type II secretion system protein GspK, partial [Deltaproteobacteria bacterium]|nr:type II secretion system protein GspK [Deltaproteobacteria bacterium]
MRPCTQKGVVLLVALSLMFVLLIVYSLFLIKIYQINNIVSEFVHSQTSYLQLKSLFNFVELLIVNDDSREVNYNDDMWIPLMQETEIDFYQLGISSTQLTGCRNFVQIVPADGKFPLNTLVPYTTVQNERAEILIRLYRLLGFDNDGQVWVDSSGREYYLNACQTVASLVDFMDFDKNPAKLDECEGFETDNQYHLFGNFKPTDFDELLSVPGYTADRISRIMPFTRLI